MLGKNKQFSASIPLHKIDERDTMFSRNELIPGTEDYNTYYKRKPESKEVDDLFRSKAGLLQPGSSQFKPIQFASADASFETIGALRDQVNGPVNKSITKTDPKEISQYIKNWSKKLGAINCSITELKPYHLYSVGGRKERRDKPIVRNHKYAIAFIVEMDKERLFAPPVESDRTRGLPTHPVFGETDDGKLVVALNGEIFTYNLKTNRARLILDRERGENVDTIVVSETGQIWFTSYNDLSIRMFDLEDGTLENYGPPPVMDYPYPNYAGTFLKAIEIDQQGRIWFLDYGMLELDENAQYVWQPIERSTIFISINNPEVEYVWIRPRLIYYFSDGNVWYSTGVGGGGITIVEYDIEEDKWCWKATKAGPLAEDDNGNIWLVAGSQIYKYTSH